MTLQWWPRHSLPHSTSFHLPKKVRSLGDFLNQHYLSTKPISNLKAMYFLRIEDAAICWDLVSPSCLCHPSENVYKNLVTFHLSLCLSLTSFTMLIMHLWWGLVCKNWILGLTAFNLVVALWIQMVQN